MTSVLDRIMPTGTTATLFVLRSMANNKFVAVQPQDGFRLKPNAGSITDACLFEIVRLPDDRFALLSVEAQCFVGVQNCTSDPSPLLAATRQKDWGPDTWETFEAIEGNWPASRWGVGIESTCNGKLLTAENNGSEYIRANRDGAYGWEHFHLMPVINMPQVLTAFADRHPGERKVRTHHSDNSGLGWVHHGAVYERRPRNTPSLNQIAMSFISDNWNDGNGTDHSYAITDWYYLDSHRVGIQGTYDLKFEHANGLKMISGWTTFGAHKGITGVSMLGMAERLMAPDMVGYSIFSTWQNWTGQKAETKADIQVCHNIVDFIGERDTGNGSRWVIRIGSDPAYPHEAGHDAGYPYEYISYDLGPSEGVYNPELSFLGYKQVYADNQGVPTGATAEEFYNAVEVGEYHRVVSPFLSF